MTGTLYSKTKKNRKNNRKKVSRKNKKTVKKTVKINDRKGKIAKKRNRNKKTKKNKAGSLPKYHIKEHVAELTIDKSDSPKLPVYFAADESVATYVEDDNFPHLIRNYDHQYMVKIPDDWKHHIKKYKDNKNVGPEYNIPLREYHDNIKKMIENGFVPLTDVQNLSNYINNNSMSDETITLWEKAATKLYDDFVFSNKVDEHVKKLNQHIELYDKVNDFTQKSKEPRALASIKNIMIPRIKERHYAPGGIGYYRAKREFDDTRRRL